MRKIAIIFIALVLLLALGATPTLADDVPAFPHAFYGSVLINGAAATDGTLVSATVSSGTVINNTQNPVTTVGGSYGINSPYLLVQGSIPEGATITFHVTNANGTAAASVTATFSAGGGPTEKNLSVDIAAPPTPTPTPTPTPGEGAAAAPAAFSISSLTISPSEVYVGEAVTISFSVANTGGQSGSYTVTLKINGVVEATKEVTVAAGKSESVSFTTSKNVAGTYSVDVNGLTGSFIVKEKVVPLAPAAFSVSSLSISPSEVYVGE
ncbi:MAG: CARDB domain-containing protein, partial [Bacteroidales bacterium]|nr:CARDB domain-containing protein [Bacteroidales bacterium]